MGQLAKNNVASKLPCYIAFINVILCGTTNIQQVNTSVSDTLRSFQSWYICLILGCQWQPTNLFYQHVCYYGLRQTDCKIFGI